MDKDFRNFLIRFILAFLVLYVGFLGLIGLSVPGGFYVPFIDHWLDVGSWLRQSLMWGTKTLAAVFGLETYVASDYVIRKAGGGGIKLVYSCLGFGVMSFWVAYIFAYGGDIKRMILWIMGGLLIIWIINVFRLTAVLFSVNSNFRLPLFDHHTWFNMVAYGFIFIMMYIHSKNNKVSRKEQEGEAEAFS